MTVIVYADFNCPYSCLASQRADELNRTAAETVGWPCLVSTCRRPRRP